MKLAPRFRRAFDLDRREPSLRLGGWLRVILLSALLAAAVCAATGLALPTRRAPVLAVALDLSASVDPVSLAETLEQVQELSRTREVRLVAFADRALPVSSVQELRALRLRDLRSGPGNEEAALWRGRSDLEAALGLALARVEPAESGERQPRRIALVSDGVETSGAWERVLPIVRRSGTPVDVVPLRTVRAALEASALRFAAPPFAGEPVVAELAVWSDRARSAELVVAAGAVEIARLTVELAAGENVTRVPVRFPDPGPATVIATVRPVDASTSVGGNGATAAAPPVFADVAPGRRVLIVGDAAGPSPLLRTLGELGWRTVRLLPGRITAQALAGSAAVVLDDVAADELAPAAMHALRERVLDGGGLLFLAGPSTFGEEGYSETPVEEILPMRFNVEEERADVALMIALDKSYSMKGEKMELAKEAAKAVVGELRDEHRFGLVAFDWNPYRVVELQLARHREEILEAIRRVEASAQTNFYPALEACFEQLREVEAKVEHVILISDGRTYPDEYERLVGEMRRDGITVSTVGVGAEADEALLADIARWGGGSSYLVADASRVQQILLDETRAKTEDTVVAEPTPVRAALPAAALDGIDLASAPPLLGHVTLEAREDAEVVLETEDEKPLLARRNVGLGRTWMFAADLGGRFTSSWNSWPEASRLVSQILADAAARRAEPRYELLLRRAQGGALVSLLARDENGRPRDRLDARVAAFRADGGSSFGLPLAQVAPGRYQTYVDDASLAEETGDLSLQAWIGDTPVAGEELRAPQARERSPGPTNTALLRRIATETGGSYAVSVAELAGRRERSEIALWPPLAVLALLLYLIELLVRRTGWPRATVPGAVLPPAAARATLAEAPTARLRRRS